MTKWLRVHEAKGSTKQRSRQTTEILTVKPLSSVPRKSDHFKHWCLQLSYARLSYHQIVNLQAGARSQIAHVCLGLFVGSDERKTAGWRVSRRGATKVVTAAHIKADGTRSFHQCRRIIHHCANLQKTCTVSCDCHAPPRKLKLNVRIEEMMIMMKKRRWGWMMTRIMCNCRCSCFRLSAHTHTHTHPSHSSIFLRIVSQTFILTTSLSLSLSTHTIHRTIYIYDTLL